MSIYRSIWNIRLEENNREALRRWPNSRAEIVTLISHNELGRSLSARADRLTSQLVHSVTLENHILQLSLRESARKHTLSCTFSLPLSSDNFSRETRRFLPTLNSQVTPSALIARYIYPGTPVANYDFLGNIKYSEKDLLGLVTQ